MVGAHIDVPMGTPMGDVPSFHQNIVQKIYIQDPPGPHSVCLFNWVVLICSSVAKL